MERAVVETTPSRAAGPSPGPYASVAARYGVALLLVVIAHAVVAATFTFIGPAMTSLFLAAVVIASLYGGRGPGLLATLLASLDLAYTFARPYNSLAVAFDDFVWLVAFMALALLTSSLQSRRVRAEELLRAAHHDLERQVIERTAELVSSQEQFKLLVNGVVDQAVFMLDQAYRVVSWNEGAERLLAYTAGEVIGRPVAKLLPPFGDGLLMKEPHSTQDQGWITRKDGSRLWAEIRTTPLQDAAGRPKGYAVSLRDITRERSLEQEIVEISDRERQRIGHDLHDGLGQELTGIAMLSTALAEQIAAGEQANSHDAEKIADLVHESIRHTRELARALCPADLEDEGLAPALRQLSERVSGLPKVTCSFKAPEDVEVDVVTASHLYRIAQEAINNAIRHGGATRIDLSLTATASRLVLTVLDNGRGFDPAGCPRGMGLRLMEYRAKAMRGSIRIGPGAKGGTIVECLTEPPVVSG
jgi:PAS domain S-box-containing protein